MLATNLMSANDLGLNQIQRDALIKVLGMLERNEIVTICTTQDALERTLPHRRRLVHDHVQAHQICDTLCLDVTEFQVTADRLGHLRTNFSMASIRNTASARIDLLSGWLGDVVKQRSERQFETPRGRELVQCHERVRPGRALRVERRLLLTKWTSRRLHLWKYSPEKVTSTKEAEPSYQVGHENFLKLVPNTFR